MAARAICELTVVVVLSLVLRRRASSLPQAKGFAAIAVCAAALFPFVAEFAIRQITDGSEPLDMLMLTSPTFSAGYWKWDDAVLHLRSE